MLIGIIIACILLLLIIWLILTYNGFIKLANRKNEAYSTIDVYLKKRYDLVPALVSVVKGYAAHEEQTLLQITAARNMAWEHRRDSLEDRAFCESRLTDILKNLFILVEDYPNLKADTNFLELQKQLQKAEEDLVQARKYYNAIVKLYNTKCGTVPSNLAASLFRFQPQPYFQLANEQERSNVYVQL